MDNQYDLPCRLVDVDNDLVDEGPHQLLAATHGNVSVLRTRETNWETALRRVRDCEASFDATGVRSERLSHLRANGDCNEAVEREALIATKTRIQGRLRSHGLVANYTIPWLS